MNIAPLKVSLLSLALLLSPVASLPAHADAAREKYGR